MGKSWRLILEQSKDGYYNMAFDEAMLIGYSARKIPTLRIYGWKTPFISLGYNQNVKEVLSPGNSLPFVRRITGGSSIIHDKELTYSLVCSLEDLSLPKSIKKSYSEICLFIVNFYKGLGLEATFAKDSLGGELRFSGNSLVNRLDENKNFCFSSWQSFDLVVNSKKIGGNAQRRKKNLVFQHGSIPLEIDFEQIGTSINGVGNLRDNVTYLDEIITDSKNFHQLQLMLVDSFKLTYGVKFTKEDFSLAEKELARNLINIKYTSVKWNVDRVAYNQDNRNKANQQ